MKCSCHKLMLRHGTQSRNATQHIYYQSSSKELSKIKFSTLYYSRNKYSTKSMFNSRSLLPFPTKISATFGHPVECDTSEKMRDTGTLTSVVQVGWEGGSEGNRGFTPCWHLRPYSGQDHTVFRLRQSGDYRKRWG